MADEANAFYVVRKGDVVGVYKSLKECQSLLGSSGYDPSISVLKGHGLTKEAEEYLASRGLKKATYSIGATDVHDKLFGKLEACPFQQPTSSKGKAFDKNFPEKRMQETVGANSFSPGPPTKHPRLQIFMEASSVSSTSSSCVQGSDGVYKGNPGLAAGTVLHATGGNMDSCILEFDGASKGNPGLAGAGAILRATDGNVVCRLREGVGIATNNVAEYRAVILGLNYALKRGCKHIHVQGDSKLVCMQVQGSWKTKSPNMTELCKVAKELKDKFMSFEIHHVERALNSEADAQANLAIYLNNGEVQVECDTK